MGFCVILDTCMRCIIKSKMLHEYIGPGATNKELIELELCSQRKLCTKYIYRKVKPTTYI